MIKHNGLVFANTTETLKSMYSAKALHINCDKISIIEIQNCISVLEYDNEKIKLDMGKVQLLIDGDELVMDTLEKGRTTVHGCILNIGFSYGDNA